MCLEYAAKKRRWLIYVAVLGAMAFMSGFNLLWLRSPAHVLLTAVVLANLVGFVAFLWLLFLVELWSARGTMPRDPISVTAVLGLATSLLLANAVALYICKFNFLRTILQNVAVPIGW